MFPPESELAGEPEAARCRAAQTVSPGPLGLQHRGAQAAQSGPGREPRAPAAPAGDGEEPEGGAELAARTADGERVGTSVRPS
jgi:hypothetical protein